MSVVYNSNHVSSKEVLERICAASNIKSVSVKKANLAESIKGFKSGRIER
jgi:ABC-2 type transport system ATP-binding protein